LIVAVFILINYFGAGSRIIKDVLMLFVLSVLIGTTFVPLFLPYLPFRSFSLKGFSLSLFLITLGLFVLKIKSILLIFASLFLYPAISAYIALNFTGASTYTSLSGVKKEMQMFLPFILIFAVVGFILTIIKLIRG
jgi:hypothetical protein